MNDEENEENNEFVRLPWWLPWWLSIFIGVVGLHMFFNTRIFSIIPDGLNIIFFIGWLLMCWTMVGNGLMNLAELVPQPLSGVIKVIVGLWALVAIVWVGLPILDGFFSEFGSSGGYYDNPDDNPLVPNRYE